MAKYSWKIILIVLLVVVIIVGAIIGIFLMGQNQQLNQSGFTQVKVFKQSIDTNVDIGNDTYLFLYKIDYHFNAYDPQRPIEVIAHGIVKTLPATVGTYNVLSLEVKVTEVNDDYVILNVR